MSNMQKKLQSLLIAWNGLLTRFISAYGPNMSVYVKPHGGTTPESHITTKITNPTPDHFRTLYHVTQCTGTKITGTHHKLHFQAVLDVTHIRCYKPSAQAITTIAMCTPILLLTCLREAKTCFHGTAGTYS